LEDQATETEASNECRADGEGFLSLDDNLLGDRVNAKPNQFSCPAKYLLKIANRIA
jgi:hypothetical protein